jgi:hypothetical protein
MDVVEYIDFINTSNIRIHVDCDTITKWANTIAAIKWDTNESKEIQILSIPQFSEDIVTSHLNYIISALKLDVVGTLTVPTNIFDTYRVPGNIANLKIYLLLSLWLGITAYIDEIILTLRYYNINIHTELEMYVNIYKSILQHRRLDSLYNIMRIVCQPVIIYPLTQTFLSVLMDIIAESQLDEYERCLLALKYNLKLPTMTIITARRLYNQGISTHTIQNEIALIEGTKTVIIDSIRRGSQAIRIGIESAPNRGLFWFYCDSITPTDEDNTIPDDDDDSTTSEEGYNDPDINVGKIIISNKKYNIIIPKENINTVCNLQQEKPLNDIQWRHKGIHSYFRFIKGQFNHNFATNRTEPLNNYNEITNHYNSRQVFEITKMDNKFRKWLNYYGMLTDTEVKILNESLLIEKYHEARYQLQRGPISFEISTSDTNLKLNHQEDIDLYNRTVKVYTWKIEYYSKPEMERLEITRQSFRENFLNGPHFYGGMVVVCHTFIPTLKGDDIFIDTNCYRNNSYNEIYHSPHPLPQVLTFKSMVESLPVYIICTSVLDAFIITSSISIGIYFQDMYEPNTIPIVFMHDEYNDRQFSLRYYSKKYDDNGQLQHDILRLIDESLIPNIDEVKAESNIYTSTHKVLTLAYPFQSPCIYVKSDLQTTPTKPYLWYDWYTPDDSPDIKQIVNIFKSETSNLQYNEGKIRSLVDEYVDMEDVDVS